MDTELWNRVKEALIECEDMPEAQQAQFLDALKARDPDCYEALMPLLEVDEDSLGFLAKPLFDLNHHLDDTTELPIGGSLGPYTLVSRLGAGGMGTVYAAHMADEASEITVAIKVLKRGLDSKDLRLRFQKERRILSFLNHQFIAKLLDYGATGEGRPYLVMEYIQGEHITHYCDRLRLSVRERLKVFQRVCAAVQYAHQNLIIHRDLKPGNILVIPGGEPKLLDFGIAKLIEPDDHQTAVTQTMLNRRAMTPDYASPEQVMGAATATSCDIYALGVVLYELLTGRRPYRMEGLSESERVRLICDVVPERPSDVVLKDPPKATEGELPSAAAVAKARGTDPRRLHRTLRGDIDTIVAKALRKEPDRRYISAEQFSADIERQLRGFPLHARNETKIYTARKFIRRHGFLVGGVLTAALILLAFSLTVWRQNARLKHERDIAEEERQRVVVLSNTFQRLMELGAGRIGDDGQPAMLEPLNVSHERLDSRMLSDRERASMALALGIGYSAIGSHDDAEDLLDTAVKLHWRAFDEEGRALPQSILTLADFYFQSGQYEKALDHYQEAMSLVTRTRAPHSWEVGMVSGRLAATYDQLGQCQVADTWFQESRQILGARQAGHFKIWAVVEERYAAHQHHICQVEEAMATYRRVLAAKQRQYGSYDLELTSPLLCLAELYTDQFRYDEALASLERARDIYITAKATYQPAYQTLLLKLANTYFHKGLWVRMEDICREGLATASQKPGQSMKWLSLLAGSLARQQRWMEAEAHLRKAVSICGGQISQRCLPARIQLAGVLRQWGELAEASATLQEAHQYLSQQTGPVEGAVFAEWQREMAAVALAEGDLNEAWQLIDRAVLRHTSELGPDTLDAAADHLLAAQILDAMDESERALEAAELAWQIRFKLLGTGEHPLVREAENLLNEMRQRHSGKPLAQRSP